MRIEERLAYKKKMKLYEKFGALWFQKLVFLLEKIEYKIIKKLDPKFLEKQDKRLEKTQQKLIKKAKSEEEIKEINRKINCAKLRTHRDYNNEKNRNYHIDNNNPTEIYSFLKWNKRVHVKGLIINGVVTPIIIIGILISSEALIPYYVGLLVYEAISTFINFECINLQNYNICRYKLIEEKLIKRQEKRITSDINDYGEVAKVVHEKIQAKEKLPTMNDIIDGIETKEQLEQLKNVLRREKQRRDNEQQKVLSKNNTIA